MDKTLNDYLEKVEKCLKPLPVSERVDIVREIKSEMLELQNEGQTPAEILERMGEAKELARAYLGDLITEDGVYGWNRVLAVCAYYSLTSLLGMFVIPVLGICAPVFMGCAIITVIAGVLKWLNALLHLGIPYINYVGIAGVESPFLVFILSIVIGVLLYLAGRGCWKLLVLYIKGAGKVKRHLKV